MSVRCDKSNQSTFCRGDTTGKREIMAVFENCVRWATVGWLLKVRCWKWKTGKFGVIPVDTRANPDITKMDPDKAWSTYRIAFPTFKARDISTFTDSFFSGCASEKSEAMCRFTKCGVSRLISYIRNFQYFGSKICAFGQLLNLLTCH